jgi:predicted kinase
MSRTGRGFLAFQWSDRVAWMGVLVILCGLPFSGKSTIARVLSERFGCAVVSLDAINEERGVGHGGEGLDDGVWSETQRLAVERVEDLMGVGRARMAVDDTCCFRFLRDDHRRAAERHGYRHVVVFVDTPEPLLRARMRENERTRARTGMTDAVFESCLARFERPGADEACVTITPGDDATGALGSIFAGS